MPYKLDTSKMYGLTHDPDGERRHRTLRVLKVGFGLGADVPDVHVYLRNHDQAPWVINWAEGGKRSDRAFRSKQEAQAAYTEIKKGADKRKYPIKFPYFTFQRMGQDNNYEPDFDAIERYGPKPDRIEIVFLKDDCFDREFQVWTKTELKCHGNGKDALRRVNWAQTPEEKKKAQAAIEQGEKFFPIIDGCYTKNCPFPVARVEEVNGKKKIHAAPCKPHGRLFFQLRWDPRLGGTAVYDTTSYTSTSQLEESLFSLRAITNPADPDQGTLIGVPITFIVHWFRTKDPAGQSVQQLGVRLEFTGVTDAVELARAVNQYARDFAAAAGQRPALSAPALSTKPEAVHDAEEVEPLFANEKEEATAIATEFYMTGDGEDVLLDPDDQPPPIEDMPEVSDDTPPFALQSDPEPGQAKLPEDSDTGPFDPKALPLFPYEQLEKRFIRNKKGTTAQFRQHMRSWAKTWGEFKAWCETKESLK